MELKELAEQLHARGCSCVIENQGIVRCFNRRGVADLFDLLENEPDFLRGASLADKVAGKGAAALMAAGGVKRAYADVVSQSALQLLEEAGIGAVYQACVPHIVNRAGTGWCPVETATRDLRTLQEIIPAIRDFLARQTA